MAREAQRVLSSFLHRTLCQSQWSCQVEREPGTWTSVEGSWLSHRIRLKSGEGLCVGRLPAHCPVCPGLAPACMVLWPDVTRLGMLLLTLLLLGASLLCCSVLNAVSVLGGQNPLRLSQNSRESRATGDHVLVRLVLHQVRSTTVLPTPRSGNWARHSSVTWLVGCLPHLVWVI